MKKVKPVFQDRYGEAYDSREVDIGYSKVITGPNEIQRRERNMTQELKKATSIAEEAVDRFSKVLTSLVEKQSNFVEASKKASGSVRDSTQKMADGLAKIEKVANFDRLERMVELLERADKALISLSELEKSGKLERILAAIK